MHTHAKNRGIHAKNRGVFIALKMRKMSLCPNSHDHVKFSHDCAKLIRIAVEILCFWTISHDYAKIIKDCSKMSPLDPFAHLCENFICFCQFFIFYFFKKRRIYRKYMLLFHFAPLSENKPLCQNSSSLSDTRNWRGRRPSIIFPFHPHSLISLPCPKPRLNIGNSHYFRFWIPKIYLSTLSISCILGIWISRWIWIEKFELLWEVATIFYEFLTNWYPLFQLSFNSSNCLL